MALRANAVLKFTSYGVEDGGIRLGFVCADPGAGEASDYFVFLSDADLAGVSTLAALKTLVTTKLQRQFRASGIATKLDPLLGTTITV